MAVNSMQVWPDAVAGLTEIQRVLKEGGVIAIAFTFHAQQESRGLTDTLARAGFIQARLEKGKMGVWALAIKRRESVWRASQQTVCAAFFNRLIY